MNKFRLPRCVLSRLKAASIDPAFLLRKSGLPPALCISGDGVISPEQFFRLWHTLGEVSDDPAIGLRIGALDPYHPATPVRNGCSSDHSAASMPAFTK
jgi:hypothetical protein